MIKSNRLMLALCILLVLSVFVVNVSQASQIDSNDPLFSSHEEEVAPNTIVIDIRGAVWKPGVYQFEQGARLFEAVAAAGGFVGEFDALTLNMAQVMVDGTQYVITFDDVQSKTNETDQKISLNDADEETLMTLPNIGPQTAKNIVEYREKNGPFTRLSDAMNVPGIGEATFATIEPYIRL